MARILPDSNDVLVYLLNDAPGTRVNTGTAGASANFSDYGGVVSNAQGLLDDAIYIPGTNVVSSVDGTAGASTVNSFTSISLSGWVFIRRYYTNFFELFSKQYFLNGWSSPFITFGFQMVNTNDGQCDLFLATSGTSHSIRTPAAYIIPQGKWCHIGGTWDGTTLKFYVNGILVNSGTFAGSIDFNTSGSTGKWFIGGIPGAGITNSVPSAIFQDLRVANIARPQSYFANIYFNGMFQNG